MSKKYGLIVPEKKSQKPIFQPSKNVFGEDADSDEESSKKPVLLRPSHNTNRQAKITQEKAVLDDPTVYQYDEIYDSMAKEKMEEIAKVKEDKKPRYIENLLKAANKRKIENERRIERQVQKERENEGEEFKDKEVFVTSAYKKKLEELRQEEEKEKREEYLESIGDVTKQRDLGGFYRHLYEQKLGADTKKAEATSSKDEEPKKLIDVPKTQDKKQKQDDGPKRNYRKRKNDNALSDGEIDDSDDEINRLNLEGIKAAKTIKKQDNLDADSDFSVDDPSSEDEQKTKVEDISQPETNMPSKEQDVEIPIDPKTPPQTEDKPKELKPKIDIWKKRTVGEVLVQALKRYYERKAARGS